MIIKSRQNIFLTASIASLVRTYESLWNCYLIRVLSKSNFKLLTQIF